MLYQSFLINLINIFIFQIKRQQNFKHVQKSIKIVYLI